MFKGLCTKENSSMIFIWLFLDIVFNQSVFSTVILATVAALSGMYDCVLSDCAPKKTWDHFYFIKIVVLAVLMAGIMVVANNIGLKETVDTIARPVVSLVA